MPGPKWPLLWCGQEGIQPHALCSGQSIELGYALQDMVFSKLTCFVSRNQVPEELVSVNVCSNTVIDPS